MSKPMYCPMSFQSVIVTTNPAAKPPRKIECTPDCAWCLVDDDKNEYGCSIPSTLGCDWRFVNTRPIKDCK